MKSYIAYKPETGEILGFVSCDYQIDTADVFQDHENYEVLIVDGKMPNDYYNYYVQNGELKLKEAEE